MAITIFERNSKELLEAFDKATGTNPLYLCGNEGDILSKALKERNKPTGKTSFDGYVVGKAFDNAATKDGALFSHADGKRYTNHLDWKDHLKRTGCHEVGNEYNKKDIRQRKVKGNFDCRKELTQATHEVLGRSH